MLGDGLAAAGAHIAGNADFDGNLALSQFFQQVGVLRGGQAMADAFGAKVDGSPDRFRARGLSGVGGEAKAVIGGVRIGIAKKFWRGLLFVAADPDCDYVAVAVSD